MENYSSRCAIRFSFRTIRSEICDPVETANVLNSDLRKIREWAEQLKMVLNIDSTKQACSKYPDLYFNSPIVEEVKTQKHLGLKLDAKTRILGKHLQDKFATVNNGIGILKKSSNYLARLSLVALYKTFMRRHLQYADIIYNKPNKINICIKIESLLYNAALAITGANRGFGYLSSTR